MNQRLYARIDGMSSEELAHTPVTEEMLKACCNRTQRRIMRRLLKKQRASKC